MAKTRRASKNGRPAVKKLRFATELTENAAEASNVASEQMQNNVDESGETQKYETLKTMMFENIFDQETDADAEPALENADHELQYLRLDAKKKPFCSSQVEGNAVGDMTLDDYNPRQLKVAAIRSPANITEAWLADDSENKRNEKQKAATAITTVQKSNSSEFGRYNPISWGVNNLFDTTHQVPLCRDENLLKLVRNPKQWDEGPLLDLARSFAGKNDDMFKITIALATQTCVINTLTEKIKELTLAADSVQYDFSNIQPNQGFNLDLCSNETIKLPSGKFFLLKDCIIPGDVSNYTSSTFAECCKAISRLVLAKLAYKDPFFVAYSPSPNARTYVSVDSQFYTVLSEFLLDGFGQMKTAIHKTSLIRLLTESFCNFSDRMRKMHNAKCKDNAVVVAGVLKTKIADGSTPNERLNFEDVDIKKIKHFLHGE